MTCAPLFFVFPALVFFVWTLPHLPTNLATTRVNT